MADNCSLLISNYKVYHIPSKEGIALKIGGKLFGAQNRRAVTVLAGVLALLCGGGGAVFAPTASLMA